MKPGSSREFSWAEALSMCLAMIGVQLSSEVLAMWGVMFYSPPAGTGRTIYVSMGLIGLVFVLGTLFDAVTDPLIGVWSDRTRPQPGWGRIIPLRGRRRPFVFWGATLMVFTWVAFWFPPVRGVSLGNFFYAAALLCLHWLFFTIAVVPLNALSPEIARSKQARVRLGQWVASGMILGLAISNIVPAVLIKKLDPERQRRAAAIHAAASPAILSSAPASDEHGPTKTFSSVGYQRTAAIFAFASLGLFLLPVLVVRERFSSQGFPQPTPPFRALLEAFKNRAFQKYVTAFFLFMTGYLAAQRVLPFWAVVGLGGDEETVAYLMGPFILACLGTALFVMPYLTRVLPLKWLLFTSFVIIATGLPMLYPIGVCNLAAHYKLVLAIMLFVYCGIGQGIQYVVNVGLLGEIIDLDEHTSGQRREAVYNGGSGLAIKMGQMMSVLLATQCMHLFGNSAERPLGILIVGPVAGFLGLLGILVVWTYPILHVTPETTRDLQADCRGILPR